MQLTTNQMLYMYMYTLIRIMNLLRGEISGERFSNRITKSCCFSRRFIINASD